MNLKETSFMRLLSLLLLLVFAACGDIETKPDGPTNNGPTNNGPTNSVNGGTPDAGGTTGSDGGPAMRCADDTDCRLGTVCGADDICIVASCDFCTARQICYRSAQSPAGSCSAGGSDTPASGDSCIFDEDCELGAVCSFDGVCVVAACDFCTETQVCYRSPGLPDGSCSAPECAVESDCAEGTCVEGTCL